MNRPRHGWAPGPTVAFVSLLTLWLLVPLTAVLAEEPNGLYEMEVLGVAPTSGGEQAAVLLRGKSAKRELTLFVGPLEAQSIAVPLQQLKPPRPLTHDLTLSILTALRAHLGRIVISDFKDNIYYATLSIEIDGKEITVDSRPRDAIALALRSGVPIYANNKALDGVGVNQPTR
ncbi:MAG: bifunctional nuclease family protein [candidate division NC10 bacterium]|nr:bifunctional nuclease family protein [candidate division NC10 bacterium]